MKCWNCEVDLPDPAWGKLSFRARCDHCDSALHSCRNCKHYKVGLPNDCAVPGTEWVADRTAANFCEDFSLLTAQTKDKGSKKRFEDLFQ